MQEQPLEPGHPGHVQHHRRRQPVGVPVHRAHRHRLGHPLGALAEMQLHFDRAGPRQEAVPGHPQRMRGDRACPLHDVDATQTVHPEPAHVPRLPAVGVEIPVPVHGHHLHRFHHPGRRLVPGGGVIVDLEHLPRFAGFAHGGQELGGIDVDAHRLVGAQGPVELVQGTPQRVIGGARHGQNQPSRRGHGETLGRSEPTGSCELGRQKGPYRSLRYFDLHQGVGGIGGHAATGSQLQFVDQLGLVHAEALRHVGDRGLADVGQPAHHGQQASQPFAGLAPRHAAARPRRLGRRAGARPRGRHRCSR